MCENFNFRNKISEGMRIKASYFTCVCGSMRVCTETGAQKYCSPDGTQALSQNYDLFGIYAHSCCRNLNAGNIAS